MAMVVKNNMAAVSTLNTLNRNSGALQKSLAKVSSGMKINSAQDDASGYAISERMRVQIRALDQANQNTQNGSSMMKTAEGAVSSTIEILKTLKEKAINAATDTNTDEDRATIQKEMNQFIDQIDDNALVTYNGKYLLEGSKVQSGQATYTAFTNQSLAKDTTGGTALTALKNRKDEDLEIQTSDRVTASYVKEGKTYTTTFEAGDKSLTDIFGALEELQDEKIFANSENDSVKKAGYVAATEESSVSGSSNGYTYEELLAAKEKIDAKVAELSKQLEEAQGAIGGNDKDGWDTSAGVTASGDVSGAYIKDSSKTYGAAAALAEAIAAASSLVNGDNANKPFISAGASFATTVTTANSEAPAQVNLWGSTNAWDGKSLDLTGGTNTMGGALKSGLDTMDAYIASNSSSTNAAILENVEKVKEARANIQSAIDAYNNAVDARDDIAAELDEVKALQKAVTDNVNAIEYKAEADGLKDDVVQLLRDQLEKAAVPDTDADAGAAAVLKSGDEIKAKVATATGVLSSTVASFTPAVKFNVADETSASYNAALDELASNLGSAIFDNIDNYANGTKGGADILKSITGSLQTDNTANLVDLKTNGRGGSDWTAGTGVDLAGYGSTYDKYLEAKTAADTDAEKTNLRKAMKNYGGDDGGDKVDIALLTGSDVGVGTSGQMISTANGENGITLTASKSGMAGQIAGITISVADAEGNVKKSVNTALNAFSTSIFAANESKEDTSLKLHVGGAANQSLSVGLKDMKAEALGLKGPDGSTVQVTTQSAANAAIAALDNALAKALDQQTTIGAIEARLEYTASNLTTSAENVQAAESAIRDADMAKEMTNYTKNNVLLQAAQSMLAQANQNASAVLSLLQ